MQNERQGERRGASGQAGTLEERLLEQARRLGFALAGLAAPDPADGFERLLAWLDAGHAGQMGYMRQTAQARRDPRAVYPPVRSVLMVGLSYAPGPAALPAGGGVARYAQGPDYHHEVRSRLKALGAWLKEERPGCWGRVCVDTAPLLERDFARRAGLGWFGKNTMLLDKRHGSWFVLGGLLLDLPLAPSAPSSASHCGTCTACLDACPTQAFPSPGVLDARKCVSYLTIELKGAVPPEQRAGLGGWLFGCDVCQDVCPWNRKAPQGGLLPLPGLQEVDAAGLLGLDEAGFKARFAGTALFPRPGRAVLLRNAALALGNTAGPEALPALRRAREDVPLVAEAAAWAIQRIEERAGTGFAPGTSAQKRDSTMDTLKELFVMQVQDAHSAETQLVQALPKMAAAAGSAELKKGFETHLEETKKQVERLEQVAKLVGAGTSGETCEAMQGLVAEGAEMIALKGEGHVRDAGLICAAQKVEHYEIALYGTLCAWASELGLEDVRQLLAQTLAEEKATDEKLTELAEKRLNTQARR